MNDDRKLRWRCRRGMRELDMVLARFLEHDLPVLDTIGRETFARLLDTSDPELYDWLLGRTAPPAGFTGIVTRLRAHRA